MARRSRHSSTTLRVKKPEAQFQDRVVHLAKLCGFRVYHTYDSRRSEPGFPDLVLVHPTRRLVLFWELKTDRGRVTPEQEEWLGDLQAAGATAAVMRPRDWPEIEALLTRKPVNP